MAKTEHYYTKFEPNCFYHIYNRTVDEKPLFAKTDNYYYFLKRCVQYIHYNPQKYGLIKDYKEYHWSSYHSYLSKKPTKLGRDTAIEWFVDLFGFLEQHKLMPDDRQEDWQSE